MQLHKNSNRKSLINVTYGSKKSKNVISQHTNIHMLPIYTYIIHTHTTACAHFKRIALAFAFINTKKNSFFRKCNPVPPCKQENDTMMTLMGTLYVCVYLLRTHTNTQIQYISVRQQQQLTYLIYRGTRRHTHIHIYHRRSHSRTYTHTHSLARHSH